MKKARKRLILLTVVLVLAGCFIALRELLPGTSLLQAPRFFSFDDKNIQKLVLTGESRTQTILPKDGGWVVRKDGSDYQADTEKVKTLLSGIHGLSAENVVSRNKAKFKDFGIGKAKIEVFLSNKTETVYIGSSYLGNDAYIKYGGRDEVFVGSGMGILYLDGDYRDLKVPIKIQAEQIQSADIVFKGMAATLTRSGDKWTGKTGMSLPAQAVLTYLDELNNLYANDILPLRTTDTNNPELTIQLKDGKQDITTYFYPNEDGSYLMQYTGGKNGYRIPNVYVSALEKTEEDFIQPTIQP